MSMEAENEHKSIIVRLSRTLCNRFDLKVGAKGLSRSEVIRMLMDQYIEESVIK